ncbi:hypothetical protein PVK06_019514 [Gossypium arboreum]|uniref:Uncharacterized protein n=1 Tax=Gossypium arboreum TaxID=29729 RepID=A0ABR0PJY4_GOSAR|nr:hypothetical protein PVK06_019514 [Gossypium arboreum]
MEEMNAGNEVGAVNTPYSRLNEALLSDEDIEEVMNDPLTYTCWKIKNMDFIFFHFVMSNYTHLKLQSSPRPDFQLRNSAKP